MKEKVKLPERGKDKKSLFRQFNFWWCYHTLNYLKCSFFFLAKAVSPTENQGRLELIIFLSRHVRLLKKELTNHWKSTCCGSEPFFACVFSIKKKERSNNYSSWYQWGWRSSKNHLLSSACCWQPSFFFFCLASAESCWLPVKVKCRTRTVQQHADCQHACKTRHNSRRQEGLWWAYGTQIEAL